MRPLDGVTVVALEHVIAGPFCTRQLADLGARIIKIERPGVGDPARAYDERVRACRRISSGPTAPRKASRSISSAKRRARSCISCWRMQMSWCRTLRPARLPAWDFPMTH